MYRELWGNINRHILVIWQSVAALLAAFTVFALIEKKVLPIDLACALLVLICAWVGAHVIDANYWFARNVHIITNVERQFLSGDDAKLIHPYFLKHRKPTVLDHLSVQAWLAGGIFTLIVGWHFTTRIAPGFCTSFANFQPARVLPYGVSVVAGVLLVVLHKKQKRAIKRLLRDSPGSPVH
jgi:hypothetical protein